MYHNLSIYLQVLRNEPHYEMANISMRQKGHRVRYGSKYVNVINRWMFRSSSAAFWPDYIFGCSGIRTHYVSTLKRRHKGTNIIIITTTELFLLPKLLVLWYAIEISSPWLSSRESFIRCYFRISAGACHYHWILCSNPMRVICPIRKTFRLS